MDFTLETKAKLFAMYWGQKVQNWKENIPPHKIDNECMQTYHLKYSWLELKPLAHISDKDAAEVAGIINETVTGNITGKKVKYLVEQIKKDPEVLGYATSRTVDFCRSKGYAVDWNGISVDQFIEAGWIKLQL